MIVAGMASIPERTPLLEQAVEALRPQVDELHVYLNGFDHVPPFLRHSEAVLSSEAAGDLGDAGKFYWLDKTDHTHYASVDDDLRYPSDYISRLVGAFDQHDRQAIVGVHGYTFNTPIDDSASRASKYILDWEVEQPTPVHVIGTATALLSRHLISLTMEDFPERNCADIQLAGVAQRSHIPMIVIPRQKKWLQEAHDSENVQSIWAQTLADRGRRVARIARRVVPEWKLYVPR